MTEADRSLAVRLLAALKHEGHENGPVEDFLNRPVGQQLEREKYLGACSLLDRGRIALTAPDQDLASQAIDSFEGLLLGREQFQVVFLLGQDFPQGGNQDALRRETSPEFLGEVSQRPVNGLRLFHCSFTLGGAAARPTRADDNSNTNHPLC